MRVQTCALLVAGTLLSVPAFAQVSFSGDWIALDEAASNSASYLSPLGDKGSIVLSNDVITFRTVDGRTRGAVERTYRLDGSETRYDVTTDGVTRSYSARSRWMGAALVITTITAAPNGGSLESMVTLSLNWRGQIEMLVLHHFPESPSTPYTHRFVYRRTVSK